MNIKTKAFVETLLEGAVSAKHANTLLREAAELIQAQHALLKRLKNSRDRWKKDEAISRELVRELTHRNTVLDLEVMKWREVFKTNAEGGYSI